MKIADENELKIRVGGLPQSEFETAVVKGIEYLRDPDGTWRYADSWIKVPGGRDLTLTERFNPKFVIASSGDVSDVERVVISGEEIEKHTHLLGWCLEHGYPVQGPNGEIFEVMVPWEVWNDHDRIPGQIYVPELQGTEAERELAEAEREYREADRALEAAAAKRAEVLRRHSEDMTRQQARAITDLSVGRIQQLIREDVDEFDPVDALVLAIVESKRPKNSEEVYDRARKFNPDETLESITRRLARLRSLELVKRQPKGFRVTSQGKEALKAIRSGRPTPVLGDS